MIKIITFAWEKPNLINYFSQFADMSDELKLYQELINKKASSDSSEIVANAGALHASIAISKLLDKTSDTVKMVVGSFDGSVSNQDNYIVSLNSALSRGVSFEIIFLKDRNTKSAAYNILLHAKNKGLSVDFKNATDNFANRLTKNGRAVHFATFDQNKFRFEKDTEKYLAWLSFNDPIHTTTLINIFDSEFKNSSNFSIS